MRIAIFDYGVTDSFPAGGCHRKMVEGLAEEHEIVVFSTYFDNPSPGRTKWIRVPMPKRPQALRFILSYFGLPLCYLYSRLVRGMAFDMVQFVESRSCFGNVSYAHFCHRTYLRVYWPHVETQGLRRHLRYLNHWLHAIAEPRAFRIADKIVVPSQGLKKEIETEYPFTRGKIVVIPNAVDIARFSPPNTFDRELERKSLKINEGDLVIGFIAQGNFEHKGLPLLIEALRLLQDPKLKLIVVGGTKDLLSFYQREIAEAGLKDSILLVGMQQDVRKYLFVADIFALPSLRETFPLVCLEAAAAGLPLLVTELYGVNEFMIDGKTGFLVERSVECIASAVARFVQCSAQERRMLGENARQAVHPYSVENFVRKWREFYSHSEQSRHEP